MGVLGTGKNEQGALYTREMTSPHFHPPRSTGGAGVESREPEGPTQQERGLGLAASRRHHHKPSPASEELSEQELWLRAQQTHRNICPRVLALLKNTKSKIEGKPGTSAHAYNPSYLGS
jgi:hypothetical protein